MRNNISKTFKRSIAAVAVTAVLGMTSASADDLVGRINGSQQLALQLKQLTLIQLHNVQ
jgi:hypothetical protein